jgi:starch phosphorylase
MLPRHLEIIYEINRRLLDRVRSQFPGDDGRAARVSVIGEGGDRHVRMANLAIVGSHSTNGVAEIHSDLLRRTTCRDLAEVFPDRFNNKTNGVTPRRWLLLANPPLAGLITDAIGDRWVTDLGQLSGLVRLQPLLGCLKRGHGAVGLPVLAGSEAQISTYFSGKSLYRTAYIVRRKEAAGRGK